VGKQSNSKLVSYLPLVLVVTFLVVVVPMLLVVWLRASGTVTSAWAGTLIGVAMSLLASYVGAAIWKTRTDSRDILFSELLLWGWVQHWRSERRLSAAADLLGLTTGRRQAISGGRLTNEEKAGLLTQLTSGLEARDAYTHGHSRRVARHGVSIAKRMGLSREEVAKIRAAGAMHDVGKVETPTAVLHKEGKLTDAEYAIIKRHPVDGAAMVSTLGDDELTAMVRHHHEQMDGTGYPDGLVGEAIPIGARILAVADTFDAITSTRPYRHAHAHKKALTILAAEAGTQLDPDAVRAFCSCYSGRRPLAYWAILANLRPRLASWLGEGLAPAKAATMGNVMATAATAATVGSVALVPIVEAPSRALADASTRSASAPTRPSRSVTTPAAWKAAADRAQAAGAGYRPRQIKLPVGANGQKTVSGQTKATKKKPEKTTKASPRQTAGAQKTTISANNISENKPRDHKTARSAEKTDSQKTASSQQTASSQPAGSVQPAGSPGTIKPEAPAPAPAVTPAPAISPGAASGEHNGPAKCEDKGDNPKSEDKGKGKDKCEDNSPDEHGGGGSDDPRPVGTPDGH